jgi:Uma2 family endonuclease
MTRLTTAPLPGTTIDPRYPDSDGRPMGDTDFHNQAMAGAREVLEDHYADVPGVYVASNLVLYYQQEEPSKRRDPDILVAKKTRGKHKRRSFRVWEEKVVPCVLFEIASRRTWRVDLHEKPALYASIGVKEYFIFDPEGRYLDPVLQGFKTVKGKPVALKPAADGSLVSKQLGLRLVPEGDMLRFIDLATGQPLPTRAERAAQAEQRAEQERRAREEERRAREEEHRAREEERRAKEEALLQAEQERRAKEEALRRAEETAAELRRVQALLAQREGTKG